LSDFVWGARFAPRASRSPELLSTLLVTVGLYGCDALIGIQELTVQNGGGGAGAGTTQCELPQDCPKTTDPCTVRACTADKQCEIRELPDGPSNDEEPNDCSSDRCEGGVAVSAPDPTDIEADANPCTLEACTMDGPTQSVATPGTACPFGNGEGVCRDDGVCVRCIGDGDCMGTDKCSQNECVPVACSDGIANGQETDVDCGGPVCAPCIAGKSCDNDDDCLSSVCGEDDKCKAPTCTDDTLNGGETDVDCGGGCPLCDNGKVCVDGEDCLSLVCGCDPECSCLAPTCEDGVTNGEEIDIDCGPNCANTCEDGLMCEENDWCVSENCVNGVCAAPTCEDGIFNGNEDGIDCGGDCPDPCPPAG
jgi:hypothetical protein